MQHLDPHDPEMIYQYKLHQYLQPRKTIHEDSQGFHIISKSKLLVWQVMQNLAEEKNQSQAQTKIIELYNTAFHDIKNHKTLYMALRPELKQTHHKDISELLGSICAVWNRYAKVFLDQDQSKIVTLTISGKQYNLSSAAWQSSTLQAGFDAPGEFFTQAKNYYFDLISPKNWENIKQKSTLMLLFIARYQLYNIPLYFLPKDISQAVDVESEIHGDNPYPLFGNMLNDFTTFAFNWFNTTHTNH